MRQSKSASGWEVAGGCFGLLLIVLANLMLLAATVWVIASVVKAVFF